MIFLERAGASGSAPLEATAIDLAELAQGRGPAPPAVPSYDGADEIRMTALLYTAAAGELGLAPGPLPFHPGATGGRTIPSPDRVLERTVHGTASDGWRESRVLPEPLSALRIPERPATPCAEFTVRNIRLGVRGDARFIYPLNEESVIVGIEHEAPDEFHVFRVDRSGAVTPLSVRPQDTVLVSGVRRSATELWFGLRHGRIASGHHDGDTIVLDADAGVLPPAVSDHVAWLELSRPPDALEAWAIDTNGGLGWFDGQRWSFVARMLRTPNGANFGLARVGPGEAYAVSGATREVLHVRSGTVTREAYPQLESVPITLASIPGFGAVLGTTRGEVLTRGAEGWTLLGGTGYTLWVNSFLPFEDGFIAGGDAGFVAQYRPGAGFCPAKQLGSMSIGAIVRLGDDLFLGGSVPAAVDLDEARITILRKL